MAKRFLLGVLELATPLAWPTVVVAQGISATLLSIGDGDTIRFRQAGKALTMQLACIDAHESAHPFSGRSARQHHPAVGLPPPPLLGRQP